MNQLCALIQKEMRQYFNSPIAYIFLVVFLTFTMWFFFRTFFLVGQLDLRSYFTFLPWVFLFFLPSLTMRMWAEEYRQGTIETLLTSSVTLCQAVAAKFLSAFLFLALTLALTLSLPMSLSFLGNLDGGVVLSSYIGALLFGGSYIAVGILMSALTKNQIVAFIVSVVVLFLLYILGESFFTFVLPSFLVPLFEFLGLGAHYDSITRGVVDSKDIIYYLSVIGVALFLNVRVLQSQR